ncbi:MAG: hypothetical protein Q8N51_08115 [Gammaproteobacteria bacterium]|nr:hypothetical protein [Gammaproteobacteria bacterium]
MLNIPYINMPGQAAAGQSVTIEVVMESQGAVWATCKTELDGIRITGRDPTWIFMTPGVRASFFFDFVMPSHDAVIFLTPQWIDSSIGQVIDEATGTVTIRLITIQGKARSMEVGYAKV